jgi:YbbR domain-containing protein
MVASTGTTQVTAVLYGPKVYASRITADKVSAYVDLRNAGPGQRKDEVKVVLPKALETLVSVLSIAPEQVEVRVRRKTSKTVPVTVEWTGSQLAGARYEISRLSPQLVTVSGTEEALRSIDHVAASLQGGDQIINGRYPVVPVDSGGNPVSEVSLSPDAVAVEATLTPTEGRQQAFVSPTYSGTPADGYVVEGVFSIPQVVTLLGPSETLRGLQSVRTRNIDIRNARRDVVRTVSIVVPQRVTSQPGTVQVRIRIKPSR